MQGSTRYPQRYFTNLTSGGPNQLATRTGPATCRQSCTAEGSLPYGSELDSLPCMASQCR